MNGFGKYSEFCVFYSLSLITYHLSRAAEAFYGLWVKRRATTDQDERARVRRRRDRAARHGMGRIAALPD